MRRCGLHPGVPEPQRSRLLEVKALLAELPKLRDEAIADALKAGGSTRAVGELIGLKASQVLAIGHAHGWPTPEMLAERERNKRERDEFKRARAGGYETPRMKAEREAASERAQNTLREKYPELFGDINDPPSHGGT